MVGLVVGYTPPNPLPNYNNDQIVQALRTSWLYGANANGDFPQDTSTYEFSGPTIRYRLPSNQTVTNGDGSTTVRGPISAHEELRISKAFQIWDDLIARDIVRDDFFLGTDYIEVVFPTGGTLSTVPNNNGTFNNGDTSGSAYGLRLGVQAALGLNEYNTPEYDQFGTILNLGRNFSNGELDGLRPAGKANTTSDDIADGGVSDLSYGVRGFETVLHEMGHTLGLSHPGFYNAGSVSVPNGQLFAQDSLQNTIMSYIAETATGAQFQGVKASTPMVYDILAIQAIYGADTNTRVTNNFYGFLSAPDSEFKFNINKGSVYSIWDAGGIDTIDAQDYTVDQEINLNPGTYSSIGQQNGLKMINNIGLAFGTWIENVQGGFGKDRIDGNIKDNLLSGFGGDDTIFGDSGNDTVLGGSGNDLLLGGRGNDTVDGGTGNDELWGNEDTNIIRGGDGDDTFHSFENSINFVNGNAGNDLYILGAGADTISDDGGYDTVRFSYASTINFQDGYAIGDPSNDVWNESFIDRIEGSNGDDMIILTIAGSGTQDIAGNGGNDILGGNADFNKIYGGNGNDYLYGRDGWDTLEGGNGNDELNGDSGNDYMTGGTGNDAINGGSGDFDTADFSDHFGSKFLAFGWTFDLVNRTAITTYFGGGPFGLFFDEIDTFSGIENLLGSTVDDVFKGHFGTYLNGNSGTDTLILEATRLLLGIFEIASDDRVDLEQGFSERDSSGSFEPPERQSFGNIEIIHTNVGNDSVVGSSHNDIVYGDEGNDTIGGAAGNDTIIGGAGSDTMDGGLDIDTLSYKDSSTAVTVSLLTNTATGGDATGDIITGFENVFGSTGSDKLTGNTLANTLDGDAGNDTLSGAAGADTLNGGIGNDTLFGGAGGDRLDGGIGIDTLSYAGSSLGITVNLLTNTALGGDAAGDIISGFERLIGSNGADNLTGNSLGNILTGGLGRDILTGGLGKDIFDFNAITESTIGATTRDLIVDFNEAATDRIDLSTIDADAILAGNNVFSFIGTAAFTALGQARVFQNGGSTYVDINTNGSLAADMRIQLTGLHTLDAADFIL